MKNKEKKVIRLLIAAGVIISILTFFVTNQAQTIRVNGQKINKSEVTMDQLRLELQSLTKTLDTASQSNEILRYRLGKICMAAQSSYISKDSLIQIIEDAQNEIAEYIGSDELSKKYAEKEQEAKKWQSAYYGSISSSEKWLGEYQNLERNTRNSRKIQDSLNNLVKKLNKENAKLLQMSNNKVSGEELKRIDALIAQKDRKIDSICRKIERLQKESRPAYAMQFYYFAEVLKKRFGKKERVKRLLDNDINAPDVNKIFLTFDINREMFFADKAEKKVKFILRNKADAIINETTEKISKDTNTFNKAVFNNLELLAGNYSISVMDAETGDNIFPDYEIALF